MIRKQAQKSGIKRVETTATSLGLRQTKRSSDENFSDTPFHPKSPFMQQNRAENPKQNPIGRFIPTSFEDGEDEKVSYLPPMASWKTRSFRPARAQITKKWQQGRNIKKWDEAAYEQYQNPNRNFEMERWQRFGRSSGTTKNLNTVPLSKRSKPPEKSKEDDISMMHYPA